jgi:hypothetical protein
MSLNLGQLIERLKLSPATNQVVIGEHRWNPGGLDSYRGYYADLAIDPDFEKVDEEDETNVSVLVKRLESAVGRTYEGYKGGDFTMDLHTRVWCSPYGEASGLRVHSVEDIQELSTPLTVIVLIKHY